MYETSPVQYHSETRVNISTTSMICTRSTPTSVAAQVAPPSSTWAPLNAQRSAPQTSTAMAASTAMISLTSSAIGKQDSSQPTSTSMAAQMAPTSPPSSPTGKPVANLPRLDNSTLSKRGHLTTGRVFSFHLYISCIQYPSLLPNTAPVTPQSIHYIYKDSALFVNRAIHKDHVTRQHHHLSSKSHTCSRQT